MGAGVSGQQRGPVGSTARQPPAPTYTCPPSAQVAVPRGQWDDSSGFVLLTKYALAEQRAALEAGMLQGLAGSYLAHAAAGALLRCGCREGHVGAARCRSSGSGNDCRPCTALPPPFQAPGAAGERGAADGRQPGGAPGGLRLTHARGPSHGGSAGAGSAHPRGHLLHPAVGHEPVPVGSTCGCCSQTPVVFAGHTNPAFPCTH